MPGIVARTVLVRATVGLTAAIEMAVGAGLRAVDSNAD